MDTKYLEYILTIAKRKNMTKAAEELYVSQSSLSQYLSKLESELDTPIFYRSKGSLTLTPAGELYVKAAENVLQIKKQLYHDIHHIEHKGHITIGVTSQFGLEMLTNIIPKFKEQFPSVTIEISELNVPTLTQMILEENIDCGIMALNDTQLFKKENIHILRKEEVFLGIPKTHAYYKDYPKRHPINIRDYKDYFGNDNILLAKKGSTLRTLSDHIFKDAELELTSVCETNSITATRSMVAMGIGISLFPLSCIDDTKRIAYYSFSPAQYRLNAFVKRKGLHFHEPEQALYEAITSYFK